MHKNDDRKYFKWGVTALTVIFISIVLVVIFTDLPGFFKVVKDFFGILQPLLIGLVLAFLMNPLSKFVDVRLYPFLVRHKMAEQKAEKLSRSVSLVFAVVFFLLIVYAFFALLLPQLVESIAGIVANAETYYKSVERWINNILEDNPQILDYTERLLGQGFELLKNWLNTSFFSDIGKVVSTVTSSVVSVVSGVINLLVGFVAGIYILWSKKSFIAQIKKIAVAIFKPQTADHILRIGRYTNRIFNGFVMGKIIDSLIIGILSYICMSILKFPFPALISTIVGVTNVIPFFGPFIGAVPSAFLILLVDPLQAFYFIIFIIVLQQVDGNIIGPRILGNTIGISGFWVLASITVATGLFGFAGMLLGVPVFAIIYMVISDAVNAALRKKGRPTLTTDYYGLIRVSDLPRVRRSKEPARQDAAAKSPDAPAEPAEQTPAEPK